MFLTIFVLIGAAVCIVVAELFRKKKLNVAAASYLVSTMIATVLVALVSNVVGYVPLATGFFQKLSFLFAFPAFFATCWLPTLFPCGAFVTLVAYGIKRLNGSKLSFVQFLQNFASQEDNQIVILISLIGFLLWLIAGGLFISVNLSRNF